MIFCGKVEGYLLVFLSIMACWPVQAQTTISGGAQEFYDQTRTGQLAIIPGARDGHHAQRLDSVVLLNSGTVTVDRAMARQGLLWFVVNHRISPASDDDPLYENQRPSFLAVMLVPVFDDPATGSGLYLYRNAQWYRKGQYRFFDQRGIARTFPGKVTDDFAAIHGTSNEVGDIDRFLGGVMFHGTPYGGEVSSWDERQFWSQKASLYPECATAPERCMLKSYLIRFTPTDTQESTRPVIFYTNVYNVSRIYIRTLSPEDDRYSFSGTIVIADSP